MHVSSLAGISVNNGINELLCSLSYLMIKDGVNSIVALGKGLLIAKWTYEISMG